MVALFFTVKISSREYMIILLKKFLFSIISNGIDLTEIEKIFLYFVVQNTFLTKFVCLRGKDNYTSCKTTFEYIFSQK
jgi:hypothetical protein